jgi:putative aminopeptidase FrvX
MRFGILIAALLFGTHCAAQAAVRPAAELLAGWVALDAPSGHEYHATDPLRAQRAGWQKGRLGNLIKIVGEGDRSTLVACLLDAPSFSISQITEEGYLRLHQAGASVAHPLWTQAHEGQQLRILTRKGLLVGGISALASAHFSNLHAQETQLTRPEDLWVDVGAQNAADVAALGIELFDPVVRHLPGCTAV